MASGDDARTVLKELKRIPGIGKSLAADLYDLGIRAVGDLNGADPKDLYIRLCALRGRREDRCVLYVFRCAVYFASSPAPDPARLKWWAWKDPGTGHEAQRAH